MRPKNIYIVYIYIYPPCSDAYEIKYSMNTKITHASHNFY